MESTNQNSTKAYVLGALIITVSLIIMGVSLSYAYFMNAVEEAPGHNKGVSITSGALTMNFATTQTINATAASLIEEDNVLTDADHTDFSVTLPSDGKVDNAQYNLYLTEIKMTQNFKSTDLKWALYSGDSQIPVASGDFSGVTLGNTADADGLYSASNINLLTQVDISKGTTTSYKLYVWLNYDADNQQNNLLQGSFKAKVAFTGVSK